MESPAEKTLCFATWNICGTTHISKRIDFLSKELGAEIIFLQETKIGPGKTFEKPDGFQCFYTFYDSKSKGVAILIKNSIPFEYICHDEDRTGGYLVLFCRLYGKLFTLVNVYQHKNDKDCLNILTEYLRETAEGVLVVGGDFNTVVDLCFDRISKGDTQRHTTSWKMFKTFSASLNLLDTWGYFHPTAKTFTYKQNKSSSRLDMFLLCEEDLERIIDIYESFVDATRSKKGTSSDHSPVRIRLKIKEQSSNEVPNVASWLKGKGFQEEPDRRGGEINGAEILSVIKSLTDSGHKRYDGITIQTYKKDRCPLTEILKIYFNSCMKSQKLPKRFNECITASDGRKHFNVDHLIFTMILAKRLNLLLKLSSEKMSEVNYSDGYCVTFAEKGSCQIEWSFLVCILSELFKGSPREIVVLLKGLVDSTMEDSFLKIILPKVSSTSGDFRELQDGCPLTRSILSLALKYLEKCIKRKSYTTHFCHFRQVVAIQDNSQQCRDDLDRECQTFEEESGIELKVVKM